MRIKNLNQLSRNLVSFYISNIEYALNLGMQPLQDIDEVNMFKDDNTVIHLKKPQCK